MQPSEAIRKAKEAGMFCFDIEHDPELKSSDPDFKMFGCGFKTDGVQTFARDPKWVSIVLKTLFADPTIDAVAYNGKYDLRCLAAAKIISFEDFPTESLCDPMVAVNLLDDNRKPGEMGLKKVILDMFGYKMASFKEASSDGLDTEAFEEYALDDVIQEYRLWKYLKPQLEEQGLMPIFRRILMPVSSVFSDMEMVGIKWDLVGARRLLRGFQELRTKMEKEIHNEIGHININSGDQLAKRLFTDLGYSTRGITQTASGKRYSTDAYAMNTLALKYPIADKIRTYRTATKMINTYIEPISRLALDDVRERVHPTIWVISTTGRTRMTDPNFQNIPAWIHTRKGFEHLNIRKNVIAADGYSLIVADLSQIELRLVAHVSRDEIFTNAYRTWVCSNCGTGESDVILHRCPKCNLLENESALKGGEGFWHGEDLHQKTCDLVPATKNRQGAKTANFALVYLATAWKMHIEYPDLSVREWEKVIKEYFARDAYFGVHKWHIRMEHLFKTRRVCTDIFGRKRRIPAAAVKRSYKHALNQFVNFIPQASACAMMELAAVNMRKDFIDREVWRREIYPVNFIHDELVFEAPDELAEKYAREIRDHMELTVQLKVPVRADVVIAKRWGDAK